MSERRLKKVVLYALKLLLFKEMIRDLGLKNKNTLITNFGVFSKYQSSVKKFESNHDRFFRLSQTDIERFSRGKNVMAALGVFKYSSETFRSRKLKLCCFYF